MQVKYEHISSSFLPPIRGLFLTCLASTEKGIEFHVDISNDGNHIICNTIDGHLLCPWIPLIQLAGYRVKVILFHSSIIFYFPIILPSQPLSEGLFLLMAHSNNTLWDVIGTKKE